MKFCCFLNCFFPILSLLSQSPPSSCYLLFLMRYVPTLELSASFRTPEETESNVLSKAYLDGIVDTEEDEEFQNISSVLSTFIILFLVSLFYSATVTVIKVK